MTHLYIANGTRQVFEFHYRIPENKRGLQQRIKVGEQIRISGDLSDHAVAAIIDQYQKYGMIKVEDVSNGNHAAPLCYSIGKQINAVTIMRLLERNEGVLRERGKQSREDAAVALANQLGTQAREQGAPELDSVAVEYTEIPGAGARSASLGSADEKIVTQREDREPKQQGRGNKNKNKN